MGRFRTLTILLVVGACGAATEGAPQEDQAPAADSSSRPKLDRPARDYLKAGAKLFNRHDFNLAAKYLNVANQFRDQLDDGERLILDKYLDQMNKSVVDPDAKTASVEVVADKNTPTQAERKADAVELVKRARKAIDEGKPELARDLATQAAALDVKFAPKDDSPAKILADSIKSHDDPASRLSSADAKQKGRWLLFQAREALKVGDYKKADDFVAQARALKVSWGLFDDTPAKLTADLEKARPKTADGSTKSAKGSKREAKQMLKQAHDLMNKGKFEQAEAIALEVDSWGYRYGMLEDNPAKVGAAARALRQRDVLRGKGSTKDAPPSLAIYDNLVHEARELMKQGKYSAAEKKARDAMAMNVVPGLTSDRAESVLADRAGRRGDRGPGMGLGERAGRLAGVAAGEGGFGSLF